MRVLRKTPDVRFGSKADIRGAKSDVRFTLNSDRKSEFPHEVMSALPSKADMCSAPAYVCFGPIADIEFQTMPASVGTAQNRKSRKRNNRPILV